MCEFAVRFQTERDGIDCRVIVIETDTTTPEEKELAFNLANDINTLLKSVGGKQYADNH